MKNQSKLIGMLISGMINIAMLISKLHNFLNSSDGINLNSSSLTSLISFLLTALGKVWSSLDWFAAGPPRSGEENSDVVDAS